MNTRRAGRALLLAAWIVALVGALEVLRISGRGALAAPPLAGGAALRAWASGRDAATMLMTGVRLVAMGLTGYLLAATLAGIAARLVRATRLIRLTDAVTPVAVRRLLAAALGAVLAAAPPSPAAFAAGGATPAVATTISVPANPSAPPTFTPLPTPLPAPSPPPATAPVATTWIVTPGDNFWHIAQQLLERDRHRPVSDAEIVPFWIALIDHNRTRLRDPDNPSLIYPGQVLELITPGEP